jgi:glycosyltransferase involved in cell wall biosynthesis
MPLRLMRVITRLTVSGPSTHVLIANRGLARRGWETLLVHGTPEPDEEEIDLASVDLPMARIPSLRRPIAPRDAVALLALVGLMRRHRPNIVHTHHSKGGLLGRLAATIARVPVRVHTFHGTVFEGYFSPRASRAIVLAERAMARLTTQLVVLTEPQRQELVEARVASGERIDVVPLGLELGRFASTDRAASRRRLGIGDDLFVLVAAGRFAPIKRLDRMLGAFARVRSEIPTARLYLLGDGALHEELEGLAATLGVSDAVTFAGWRDNVADWYAAADVVVNSSDNEGTPLALIEAAATGRPVVATRVGGVADVVDDGRTGILVERQDLQGLAEALVRLARDVDDRKLMGEAARQASARYSSERLVNDLDLLYRRLLRDHRRVR